MTVKNNINVELGKGMDEAKTLCSLHYEGLLMSSRSKGLTH